MKVKILTFGLGLILITLTAYSQALGIVRQPAVAGSFYPADSASLERELKGR